MICSDINFDRNTMSNISKLLYIRARKIWDNFEISGVGFMPNITSACYLPSNFNFMGDLEVAN